MNYAEICIIKRDGKREDFSISKIKNAVSKAFSATGINDEQQLIADITMNVIGQFASPTITVEEIRDYSRKRADEGSSGSSQKVHHLSGMEKYRTRQKDPDEACDGRYRSH
ncbi:ATP cone domain-containing protein [Bacteroides fragilis]|nr:ATP cone domain-containing protein [Bacteroides fragilis]